MDYQKKINKKSRLITKCLIIVAIALGVGSTRTSHRHKTQEEVMLKDKKLK